LAHHPERLFQFVLDATAFQSLLYGFLLCRNIKTIVVQKNQHLGRIANHCRGKKPCCGKHRVRRFAVDVAYDIEYPVDVRIIQIPVHHGNYGESYVPWVLRFAFFHQIRPKRVRMRFHERQPLAKCVVGAPTVVKRKERLETQNGFLGVFQLSRKNEGDEYFFICGITKRRKRIEECVGIPYGFRDGSY